MYFIVRDILNNTYTMNKRYIIVKLPKKRLKKADKIKKTPKASKSVDKAVKR